MARSSESLDVSVRSAAGGEYSDRLAREQLIALNRQGRSTNFVPPATSIILVGMRWGGVSPVLLLVWLGLVWATSVLRFFMYQRFETQVVLGGGDDRGWRRIWVGVYGLSGAVWGIGSVLMFPQDSVLIQTFLVVFVLGMASGGTASFAPYLPALIAYVVPLTFPIATVLLLQESTAHVILGFGGYIFVLALGFLGRAGSRNFAASFRLGIENEDLAQELTAAQIRLAGALDSMSEAFALFDADECLVECNNKFDELLPEIQPALFSGLAFEKFFELLGHSDQIRGSVGRTNEWSDEIVRRCQTGELPIEIELSDGRWLMLNQAATDDGGIVTTFADISQLKQHEAEISDSEQRFRDFASAATGFHMGDRGHQFSWEVGVSFHLVDGLSANFVCFQGIGGTGQAHSKCNCAGAEAECFSESRMMRRERGDHDGIYIASAMPAPKRRVLWPDHKLCIAP